MKKLLLIALAGALAPASAYAALTHRSQMHAGTDTAARAASHGCAFRAGDAPRALLLRCPAQGGTATARYRFKVGAHLAGKPAAHVEAVRRCCATTKVHAEIRMRSGDVAEIAVSVGGPATVEVKSVSLSYYVKR